MTAGRQRTLTPQPGMNTDHVLNVPVPLAPHSPGPLGPIGLEKFVSVGFGS